MPSEAEEILAILQREQLKWRKDGRRLSADTKTLKTGGRAKAWRDADATETAENRRKGTGKAALTKIGAGGSMTS